MERLISDRFEEFISRQHLFNKGDRLLLAVSGGSDSMTMCDLFVRSGFTFGIAHCNFQLRGGESLRDENFVREYAARCRVPFHVVHFDTEAYAGREKIAIQETARILRYEWFEQVRKENGYTFIVTAHHLNDHIETLLLNFFKGTGIHGLHGIRAKQGKVVRPMLFLTKDEITQYVEDRRLEFVEDASNASDKYTRNYIRHRVVPVIKDIFPGLERQLEKNIERFTEAGQLYDQAIDAHRKKLVIFRGEEAFIPVLKLRKSVPLNTICYELFKSWGFSAEQSRQIAGMADSEPGKSVTSSTHRLIRDRKWFIVTPLQTGKPSVILIEEDRRQADVPHLSLRFARFASENYSLSKEESVASIDGGRLVYPLVLRPWRQGDYFYPLGLNKKKKVSRFLIDRKVPLHEKEKVWVLESGKRIVWVVGMRLDHRFRVTPATEEILQITAKIPSEPGH